ncbi:prominin-1-A-like isoform X2 [Vidua chalybeata]|uniref:prominin-1-A-like isoform X2 n=1 Tax=Vidua chalybeata TaxID=81927 RepID=UPI0023A8128F|nr:prominin-1-A-like isoform X2 [Vidua chalybeata]
MELGNISKPTYGPGLEAPGSSTPGVVTMAHGFLRLVQPNPLPIGLINFGQSESEFRQEDIRELLLYELGFLVCVAIGVLLIILVPLVGCCFCCCRCCGNCGGRMYQKQGRRMGCRRRALWASVLLVSAFLLAGGVCALISNTRFSQAVKSTFSNVNNTLDNIHTYLASIPQQVDFIINKSDVPLDYANHSLQDIGPKLGSMIASHIRSSTEGALGSLWSLLQGMETLNDTFANIAISRSDLEELQSNYSQRLVSLRGELNHTLQKCGLPCGRVSLDGLAFTANFSTIPGVEQQLEALREVSESNIETDLEEVNRTLGMTPDKVQEQSQQVVAKSQDQLGLIRQEIRSLQEGLPLLDAEEKVGAFVNNATSVLEKYREPIIAWDGLRLIVCALLCCTVLLVVLCNVFGLLLGPLGLKEGVLPTERSSLANAGGNFFMAGVGFSFIFFWLLMLLVMIIFMLGGNIYMLFCESWRNQQLFQLLDNPGKIPNFNLSELLGLKGDMTNFSEIYRQCQQDASLWQTLHLDQSISLDKLLNISQYAGNISTAFEKMNISLSPISLLKQSQKDLLLNASRAGQPPNFTLTLEQLDQNMTQGSLLDLAAELEQLAEKGTDVKKDLEDNARKLRELEKEMQASFSGPLQSLKENIHSVQSGAAQLEGQTTAALDKASRTQEFLERETPNIIKNETLALLEQLLDFFETYISWAKSRVTEDVARCKPIAQSLDNVEVIGCDYIMDSVNAFWFSLGWCTLFLLPSIILAVRLAKFYRRMDIADVYRNEDFEMPPTFNSYKIPRPSTRH